MESTLPNYPPLAGKGSPAPAPRPPSDFPPASAATPFSPKRASPVSTSTRLLCPSAPAREKAILLGVIRLDGTVAFLKDRLLVTPEFLATATRHGAPETRYRFSSPCIGSACQQWAHGGCSLPTSLASLLSLPLSPTDELPACSIRSQCRWFAQHADAACRTCPLVVTKGYES
jgi:hypothetical protein